MRSPLIAAVIAAIPSVALAQPSPPPPAAPPPPPAAQANTPHANANWNTDHFHFDYDDGGCHFVYEYNFKSGDMHLDRHGDCPHP
jgi:hypothetical protein